MNKARDDIRFAAEKTLGKLAKWLRILGFDTLFEQDYFSGEFRDSAEKDRILLTRTRRVREQNSSRRLIFVKSDNPFEQIREVIQALGIVLEDIRAFSRCLQCNVPTKPANKDSVRGKVPDYVWETQELFQVCSRCHKIYWPGTHTTWSMEIIRKLFDV